MRGGNGLVRRRLGRQQQPALPLGSPLRAGTDVSGTDLRLQPIIHRSRCWTGLLPVFVWNGVE